MIGPSPGKNRGFFLESRAMKDAIQLRRHAEECRQLAAIELDEDDKAYWLRKAEDWERLAAGAENQPSQRNPSSAQF